MTFYSINVILYWIMYPGGAYKKDSNEGYTWQQRMEQEIILIASKEQNQEIRTVKRGTDKVRTAKIRDVLPLEVEVLRPKASRKVQQKNSRMLERIAK